MIRVGRFEGLLLLVAAKASNCIVKVAQEDASILHGLDEALDSRGALGRGQALAGIINVR